MKFKPTEKEIAQAVISWLRNLQWTIYQEVQMFRYGPIADIVAVQNNLLWVVETKQTLTFKVIEQARKWKQYSHYVSVAVPSARIESGRAFAEDVLKWQRIGLITVAGQEAKERIGPKLIRFPMKFLKEAIKPQHQYWAEAGNAHGDRYTPFAETCREVCQYVSRHPGVTAKELINNIKTHYTSSSTARACILKWAQLGKIKGVRIEEGKLIRFFPTRGEDK